LNRRRVHVATDIVNPPPLPLQAQPGSPAIVGPDPEHLAQIVAARQSGAKLRRAAIVAILSGWATAIFALLTLISGIFDVTALILGMGMAVVSQFEFRGASALRKLHPSAPRRLATNQVAFGVLLFSYATLRLYTSQHQPGAYASAIASDPQLASMLGPIESLTRTIYIAIYGGMMLLAIVGPGLTALYYLSRRKHLEAHLARTPRWILDLQRAGVSV
jgi:hypothetical protein